MQFLYFLEDLRAPLLDRFMLQITQLGEETAFLVVALILFWCINKYYGYYLLSVGFLGTVTNQFLKLLFRIPRPWVIDPEFTILEEAREAAGGYSFPSGHTQSAVGTFGTIAIITKNRWIRIAAIAIAVLVSFSRMYIGVHTPADVLTSVILAVIFIIVLKPIILGESGKSIPFLFGALLFLGIAFLCYVTLFPFPADVDSEMLASGVKNACTLLGALTGLLVVYFLDEKWLHFSTDAVWWAQVLKVILGCAIVLAIKSGLKEPLNALFGISAGRAVRYFLIVVFAGSIWPLSFRWFEKLGKSSK